eukprot:TRINITY_DN3160_c0_g1_i6.p1 TRINITY_DN3160_c0_g1~~TRINITY_DN3160_c0_g1_i6.p1  ORF type:complete len:267 (-),score=49.18 TRINITY_DN3160_c0_g1_i6:9-809(-)
MAPIGSPYGTSSPITINPDTMQPYKTSFPEITFIDQANAQKMLMDSLDIDKIHLMIGGSSGGMGTLQFASQFPDLVSNIVALCCTGKTTNYTKGYRIAQRQAVLSDCLYKDGNYDTDIPLNGLKVARIIGHLSFRTRDFFNHIEKRTEDESQNIENYLNHIGDKFARDWDPNCFLALSRCLDTMDLGLGRNSYIDGVKAIKAKTLLIASKDDILTNPQELEMLYQDMKPHNPNVSLKYYSSIYGHDVFFTKPFIDWLYPQIQSIVN